MLPIPPKMLVPPLTVTPDFRVGCEAPLTTIPEPPLAGVLKANTVEPTVIVYQVLRLHDEA